MRISPISMNRYNPKKVSFGKFRDEETRNKAAKWVENEGYYPQKFFKSIDEAEFIEAYTLPDGRIAANIDAEFLIKNGLEVSVSDLYKNLPIKDKEGLTLFGLKTNTINEILAEPPEERFNNGKRRSSNINSEPEKPRVTALMELCDFYFPD